MFGIQFGLLSGIIASSIMDDNMETAIVARLAYRQQDSSGPF
jgi:hypothetical protein